MKVALLAGGFGTRLAELTDTIPKPMVDIGGSPILWHIMKLYATQGFPDFVVALGYKGEMIRDYFANYAKVDPSCRVSVAGETTSLRFADGKVWNITLVDTGQNSMTGGRLRRLAPYLGGETFMLTYGDGVADVALDKLLAHHRSRKKTVTVTAINPTSRYGKLDIQGDLVTRFSEKPTFSDEWINGGFFVMEPGFLELIPSDETVLEREPLETVARRGELTAYKHAGFWHCMDTLRDQRELAALWQTGKAPWKIW